MLPLEIQKSRHEGERDSFTIFITRDSVQINMFYAELVYTLTKQFQNDYCRPVSEDK